MSLTERKQQRARQRIIEAADELFTSRGFDAVSVTDIAARAETGRTTFFRYFGDKTEVVFAKEQAMLDAITSAGRSAPAQTARGLRAAIEQLRPIVLELWAQAAKDAAAYERHYQLIEQHLELRARDALKTQQLAENLSKILTDRGTPESTAFLAAQVALACYQAARRSTSTTDALPAATGAAFDEILAIRADQALQT